MTETILMIIQIVGIALAFVSLYIKVIKQLDELTVMSKYREEQMKKLETRIDFLEQKINELMIITKGKN